MNIENSTTSLLQSQLNVSSCGLVLETMKFSSENIDYYYQNTVGIKKLIIQKNAMLLQCRFSYKLPASSMFLSVVPESSVRTGWRWWYSVGPGATSAESCTHPAKRDRCFSPPIAERQRLPNLGIESL